MTERRTPEHRTSPPERRRPPQVDPSHERDAEALLAAWFDETAPQHEPPVLVPNVLARTALTRQRPRWFTGVWWRDLLGGGDRRFLSRMQGASLGAAVMAVLLLVVVVWRPFETATVYRVAADGSGDHITIAEAVALAMPGEVVEIAPGTYTENLVIDQAITVRGHDPESVIVQAAEPDAPAILVDAADATIEDLTVTGRRTSVALRGGAPTVRGLVFDAVGTRTEFQLPSLVVSDGSRATVAFNEFKSSGPLLVESGAAPTVESNTLRASQPIWLTDAGEGTVVQRNRIVDPYWYGIWQDGDGAPRIEDNDIGPAVGIGIQVDAGSPEILENTITESQVGLEFDGADGAIVRENTVEAEHVAIKWNGEAAALFADNSFCGAEALTSITTSMVPVDLTGNTLCEGAPATVYSDVKIPVP